VKEGLFLDRIARQGADVTVGHPKLFIFIEAYAADAVAAGLDEAAVAAGVAADVVVREVLDEGFGGGDGVAVEHLLEGLEAGLGVEEVEGGHGTSIIREARAGVRGKG
jgi:hypothetical protein